MSTIARANTDKVYFISSNGKANHKFHFHNDLVNLRGFHSNKNPITLPGFKNFQVLKKIPVLLFLCLSLFTITTTFSQCIQIESILVDACGPQEGLNEMVRFKVGGAPVNTNTMSVDWPNNPWQGLIKNATTAAKVAVLNGDILDAGGCGQLIEPTNGVLPANASVILVTSFNIDTALNAFGPITDTIYIIFQNNATTASGHFANFGDGLRTLELSFGA
ncbi:MAG: hypothetical protein EOP06_27775, partial [Proteobacteria bacterium]